MIKLISIAFAAACLIACASTPPSTRVVAVNVELPENVEWSAVTDRADNLQYIKEWVPAGEDPSSASWIISTQKLTLDSGISAKSFQKKMFSISRNSCTDVLFNGPQEIMVNDHKTSVGMIMCAKQHNKPFGAFSDQRIIVDGNHVYVVTSELSTPASEKAGVLSFSKDETEQLRKFMKRQVISSNFVRDSIDIQLQ